MISIVAQTRQEVVEEGTTVIVAATDRDTRTGIVGALGPTGLRVRGVASLAEVLPAVTAPDLLLIHCEELGSEDLTVLRDLRREYEMMQIIVVCAAANARTARRAIDGGVNGLVFTEQVDRALGATVEAVLAGQTVVPSQLRAGIQKPSLSFREKQILGLVVMGFTNNQIGLRLFLAESTVKSHLSSAFAKLGVRSRSEAAALILDPNEPLGMGILRIAESLDPQAH